MEVPFIRHYPILQYMPPAQCLLHAHPLDTVVVYIQLVKKLLLNHAYFQDVNPMKKEVQFIMKKLTIH